MARWNDFVGIVSNKINFQPGHLAILESLCNMYEELFALQNFIKLKGHTYEIKGGAKGFHVMPWPQVKQLNRVRVDIRSYSIMLGLSLASTQNAGGKFQDSLDGDEDKPEGYDEWEDPKDADVEGSDDDSWDDVEV